MSQNLVIIKQLQAPHQKESFTRFLPLSKEMVLDIEGAVKEIFDAAGGSTLLKPSRDIYLKPNGIDAKPYCYTRLEFIEAVIKYWQKAGARRVFLIENSTQSNYTRLVYESNGYKKVCKKTGAIPVYLDEEKTETFDFKGRKTLAAGDPEGYELGSFEMPRTVARKLIKENEQNLYINLPKLKTHSMAGVTLGVKNQWGFPVHSSRGKDHNYNLPSKLVDVLSYVKPDFTLIEGIEGTIYGHYPVAALADSCVKPFRILIGSGNVVAADLAGAKIFGLDLVDVPHLQMAISRGFSDGVGGLDDITLTGDITDLTNIDILGDKPESGKYPTGLYDSFPEDVNVVVGKTLACKEGCLNNPLTLLQIFFHDFHSRGGWNLVLGKGHDPAEIDRLEGPVLIAGHCAIEEVSERLIRRLGRKKVYLSGECNDLCSTAEAMFHLTKVNPVEFCPVNPVRALTALFLAKLHGSKSRVPSVLSHILKRV